MMFLIGDAVELSLTFTVITIIVLAAAFNSSMWILLLFSLYVITAVQGMQLLCFVGANLKTIQKKSVVQGNAEESCGVCGGDACKRHRPSLHSTQVRVPKDFDAALENLLEQLLQTYVCAWYSNFSSDDAFVQQLKIAIATATRNIADRLLRANVPAIIFNNLIPIALHHAQDWRILSRRAKEQGGNPEDYVTDYLGPKVHPAAYSRSAELNYLRGLIMALMPHLLPATHISTNNRVILREVLANWVLLPAIDALANPDNINTLIILSTRHNGVLSQTADSMCVPMLHSWATPLSIVQSAPDPLKPSLEEVLNNAQLLYLFMQHIKKSGPVRLLQFCLDIDDLSKRMLNPEMTPDIEESLYIDAQNIYSTYLNPEAPDYLHLPLYISKGMESVLAGGPEKVQELRTSRPLYQAHQEAHALLEATCLPSFHHSYELYKLLCGQQPTSMHSRSSTQSSSSSGAGVGARLSSQLGKIRGALRASAVDGAPFQSQRIYQAEEVDCSSRVYSEAVSDRGGRDLTTWRVTVPHVDGGGAQPLYTVAVHGAAEEKFWTVLRRDSDFYALRARLAEFHGDKELNDSPLPTRKNQHPSLAANRQRYQDFLQRLLSKPTLRSSELLYGFLTAPNLKPYLTNYSAPDIGVLYQSMAHRLRKERGQHLDKFMSVFLASTCVKSEHADLAVEMSEHRFHEPVRKGPDLIAQSPFGNNLNLNPRIQDFPYVASRRQHVTGASYCAVEAADTLLNVSPPVSRVLWLVATLARRNVDPMANRLLYDTLVKLLSGGRAALVVKLLYSSIFDLDSTTGKDPSSHVDEDKRQAAKQGLHDLIPWWMVGLRSTWCSLMDSLLDPLQNAPLNKHLAYVLLDQLLASLFPELAT
ncbi:sorting nexin-14 isoform X2 [Orussus abietinus]|uniref:sorting nexin-14 isoform X2 n=1 Tax=Orussus abietinus TaxID=222816 RepID=UPI000625263B|nr:sorting nexin-14 isoform X2 [Orussus abietinus]